MSEALDHIFPALNDAPQRVQRIVLEHTQGICKGLFGIYGTTDDLKSIAPDGKLPEFIPDVNLRDHTNSICLVRVTPRYVLYREITPPPASGKLGEFHPEQK